jgi:hypothetical protein
VITFLRVPRQNDFVVVFLVGDLLLFILLAGQRLILRTVQRAAGTLPDEIS